MANNVLAAKREKGQLHVSIRARALCTYTLHIVSNANVFQRGVDDDLIFDIKNQAKGIFRKIWRANRQRLDDPKEFERRQRLQSEALEMCEDLEDNIQIAKPLFHLSRKRIGHWGGLIEEVSELTKAWAASDRKRNKAN